MQTLRLLMAEVQPTRWAALMMRSWAHRTPQFEPEFSCLLHNPQSLSVKFEVLETAPFLDGP
jgi:hypothetical protein